MAETGTEPPSREFEEIRAGARLPHLRIDTAYRRRRDGTVEPLSMTLEAVPSFEALGEFLERVDPFQAWLRLAQAWWLPWLKAVEGA